jgi:hypothetical protein
MLENIEQMTSAIEHVVTTLALITGGIWAYYKVFKSRTFVARVVLSISGSIIPANGTVIVAASFQVKNVGLSQIKFRKESALIRLLAYTEPSDSKIMKIDWKLLGAYNIFERHSWIEPGEVISDEVAISIPTAEYSAFLLELRIVGGVPNRKNEVLRFQEWLERAIVQSGSPIKVEKL